MIDGHRLPNGLDVRKVRVPLGVVAVVYEARPNVTIDAAALCLKSGQRDRPARLLLGDALQRRARRGSPREAAVAAGLPEGCVSLVAGGGREELAELATQRDAVDLIIPRGGESLKEALQAVATVPVIYAASGNCHVYVDAGADLEQRAGDRAQRQDAAPRRLQRRRDAARPRGASPTSSCRASLRALAEAGVRAARRRARAARWPRAVAGAMAAAGRGGGLGDRVPRR